MQIFGFVQDKICRKPERISFGSAAGKIADNPELMLPGFVNSPSLCSGKST